MGLDKKELEKREQLAQDKKRKIDEEAAKTLEIKSKNARQREAHSKRHQKLMIELDKLSQIAKRAKENGIQGYETWVTIQLRMVPSHHQIGKVVSAAGNYFVTRALCFICIPLNAAGNFIKNEINKFIKENFTNSNEIVQIPNVLFFADLKNDNTLDLQVLSDSLELTGEAQVMEEDRQSFKVAVKDWIASIEPDKYTLIESTPNSDSYVIKDDSGNELTPEKFRDLRDDPTKGLVTFLNHRFDVDFDFVSSPDAPRPGF